MLKNIWYCIKKTSEWYFALLVLYIILTLVNATIPILSAFLLKLVIENICRSLCVESVKYKD